MRGDAPRPAAAAHGAGAELGRSPPAPEVTVVMPCLNEAETLAGCIGEARAALAAAGLAGELVVADNGSTDGSPEIAARLGARVVRVADKGYGNAVLGGVAAARGRYVIMGDADGSYDFGELTRLLAPLRDGAELVIGCRLPAGGGRIQAGAMPWAHRWIGNPALSWLGRFFFAAPVHDFHCGLRGFDRHAILALDLRCPGMELASEMVVKATLAGLRTAEVPVTLRPDGRNRPPHLRSFRDGWRHLRFMLLFSPRWLFLVPALVLSLVALTVLTALIPGPVRLGGVTFDVNTMVVAAVALLTGVQAGLFGILSQAFAVDQGLIPETPLIRHLRRFRPVELGIALGGVMALGGAGWLLYEVDVWRSTGFGALPMGESLRMVVPAVTAFALGVQLVFWGFALAVLALARKIRLRVGSTR